MILDDEKDEREDEDEDDIEEGMEEEKKEHKSLPKSTVKQIVKDHLAMDEDYYEHERGTGGAGGSPCKFRKREGGLEDKRVIHGLRCKEPPVHKGRRQNFD